MKSSYEPISETEVVMAVMPICDIPDCGSEAQYDGKTIHGPWAYMCELDYQAYGVGIGLGKGQRLVKKEDQNGNQSN